MDAMLSAVLGASLSGPDSLSLPVSEGVSAITDAVANIIADGLSGQPGVAEEPAAESASLAESTDESLSESLQRMNMGMGSLRGKRKSSSRPRAPMQMMTSPPKPSGTSLLTEVAEAIAEAVTEASCSTTDDLSSNMSDDLRRGLRDIEATSMTVFTSVRKLARACTLAGREHLLPAVMTVPLHISSMIPRNKDDLLFICDLAGIACGDSVRERVKKISE